MTPPSTSKPCSAGVDEIQFLMLLVIRIGMVVLTDDAVASSPRHVPIDPERSEPEVVANRQPLGVGM